MASEATCVTNYRAYATCDGLGSTDGMVVYGPYTVEASALAAVQAHGAVCTGLGDPEADPVVPATCRAGVRVTHEWQNVIIAP